MVDSDGETCFVPPALQLARLLHTVPTPRSILAKVVFIHLQRKLEFCPGVISDGVAVREAIGKLEPGGGETGGGTWGGGETGGGT